GGEAADLAAAADLRLLAMAAGPLPSQVPHLCTGLASVLRDRFERHGDMTDLSTALTAARMAVRACADDPGSRGRCLANLSGVHRTRFERTRRPKDLLRAVRSAREAVAVTTAGALEFPSRLGTLTLALLRDFGHHRDRRRVDEAIAVSRSAVAATHSDHPQRPALLANAANALRARYEWTGDLADLDEAVALAQESVDTSGGDDTGRMRRRVVLATARLRRFEGIGRPDDIDEAVEISRSVVDWMLPDHPHRPGLLTNLSLALFRRFEENGREPDLTDCLRNCEESLRDTAEDDPEAARRLSLFAVALRERFLLTGVEADLDAAIAVAAAAVSRTRDGETQFNLGMALRLRYERDKVADVDSDLVHAAAVAAFEGCARSTGTAPLVRAAAVAYLARLHGERRDWPAADASYEVALGLLPVLTGRQLGWDSRHAQLGRLAGLGVDAAAVALRQGDKERALAILEESRGVLLRQSIEQRGAADEVRRIARDLPDEVRDLAVALADEFDRLSALLSADTASSTEFDVDPASMADPAAARREIAAGWEHVVDRIRREVPGLERFRAPLRFDDLAPAAAQGPVVVVNVSRFGCDALIVRKSGVQLVPLPGLDHAEVAARVERFVRAVEAADGGTDSVMHSTLDWLRRTTAGP
ncbi:hypothetical protein AB0G02_37455, partial [Actinosynnema sp. NPDC023658]